MTPSLQNPHMFAHPVLLYLGDVGLTMPFAVLWPDRREQRRLVTRIAQSGVPATR